MNDIKLRWKYDLELQLIEELHADFNSTEKSELRKAELTTLIDANFLVIWGNLKEKIEKLKQTVKVETSKPKEKIMIPTSEVMNDLFEKLSNVFFITTSLGRFLIRDNLSTIYFKYETKISLLRPDWA